MRLGLLAIVAAACGDPPGLTLDIHVDSNIAMVEVFVGKHCSDGCPAGVVPPDLAPRPIDGAYLVPDTRPWPEPVKDGVVGFRIASDHDITAGIIVILGYDAAGNIAASSSFYDVDISAGDAVVWRVDNLVATDPIRDFDRPPAGTRRIKAWHKQGFTLPTCLLIEAWTDQPVPDSDLVVPETDTDCDGVMANECDPWRYFAPIAPPTLERSNCVSMAQTPGGTSVCMISGPQCSEQTGAQPEGCVPLREAYCVPAPLCSACQLMPNADACLAQTINAGFGTMTPMAHLECRISLDESGNACSDMGVTADAGLFLSNNVVCTDIHVSDLKTPFGPFVSEAPIDQGKLKLGNFRQPCKIDVSFEGTATSQVQVGLVELELDNTRHLVMPARLELFRSTCSDPGGCTFVESSLTTDTMLSCVRDATPLSCAPTTQCPDGGSVCGGKCCGSGESCAGGQCTCGGGPACMGGDTCRSAIFDVDQCGTICCGVNTVCPN